MHKNDREKDMRCYHDANARAYDSSILSNTSKVTHTQCISPSKNDTKFIHTTLITQTQDRTCIVRNYMHILVAAP